MQKVSLQNIPDSMRQGIERQLLNGNRTSYAISKVLGIHVNTIHAIGLHMLGKEQFELRELKAKEALLKESDQLTAQGLPLHAVAKKLNVSRSYLLRVRRNFKDSSAANDSEVVQIISMADSSADAVSESKSSSNNAQKCSDRESLADQNRSLSVSDVAQHKKLSDDVGPSGCTALSDSSTAYQEPTAAVLGPSDSSALSTSATAYQRPSAAVLGPSDDSALSTSATAYQGHSAAVLGPSNSAALSTSATPYQWPPVTCISHNDSSSLSASATAYQGPHAAVLGPSDGSAVSVSATKYHWPPVTCISPNDSSSLSASATAYQRAPAICNGTSTSSVLSDPATAQLGLPNANIAYHHHGSALCNSFASVPAAQVQQKTAMPENIVSFKFRGAEFSYISGTPGESQAEKSVLSLITQMMAKGIL